MKIKKGDMVKVIAGKDKDKEGKVIAVDKKDGRVLVEGVNKMCIRDSLVHMAVVNQLANNRQGTQKAKTRSEVSGCLLYTSRCV